MWGGKRQQGHWELPLLLHRGRKSTMRHAAWCSRTPAALPGPLLWTRAQDGLQEGKLLGTALRWSSEPKYSLIQTLLLCLCFSHELNPNQARGRQYSLSSSAWDWWCRFAHQGEQWGQGPCTGCGHFRGDSLPGYLGALCQQVLG